MLIIGVGTILASVQIILRAGIFCGNCCNLVLTKHGNIWLLTVLLNGVSTFSWIAFLLKTKHSHLECC